MINTYCKFSSERSNQMMDNCYFLSTKFIRLLIFIRNVWGILLTCVCMHIFFFQNILKDAFFMYLERRIRECNNVFSVDFLISLLTK